MVTHPVLDRYLVPVTHPVAGRYLVTHPVPHIYLVTYPVPDIYIVTHLVPDIYFVTYFVSGTGSMRRTAPTPSGSTGVSSGDRLDAVDGLFCSSTTIFCFPQRSTTMDRPCWRHMQSEFF